MPRLELAEILNGNWRDPTELEKLAAYAGAARRITLSDIELCRVGAQIFGWELRTCWLRGSLPKHWNFSTA